MADKFIFSAGERVIFTAWGTQELAAHALVSGAEVLFCDIDPACGGADLEHLKELVLTGASKFFTYRQDAAADFARAAGVEVIILPEKEAVSDADMRPAYDSQAFRYATPPDGQYPYYMLYLNGVETFCRECAKKRKGNL